MIEPPPVPPPTLIPTAMPPKLDHHERLRIRAAAYRAKTVYPGPVGELLSRELNSWDEFGYRFGGTGLVRQIVDDIMRPRID